MRILRYSARRETQAPAKTFERHAPAEHLVGDRDRHIGFADIAALPEPDWADVPPVRQFWPGRYAVESLVPAGRLDDTLSARLDAVAAVWFDAQFDDDDTEGEADR